MVPPKLLSLCFFCFSFLLSRNLDSGVVSFRVPDATRTFSCFQYPPSPPMVLAVRCPSFRLFVGELDNARQHMRSCPTLPCRFVPPTHPYPPFPFPRTSHNQLTTFSFVHFQPFSPQLTFSFTECHRFDDCVKLQVCNSFPTSEHQERPGSGNGLYPSGRTPFCNGRFFPMSLYIFVTLR